MQTNYMNLAFPLLRIKKLTIRQKESNWKSTFLIKCIKLCASGVESTYNFKTPDYTEFCEIVDVLYILPHFCILMALLQCYLTKTAATLKNPLLGSVLPNVKFRGLGTPMVALGVYPDVLIMSQREMAQRCKIPKCCCQWPDANPMLELAGKVPV